MLDGKEGERDGDNFTMNEKRTLGLYIDEKDLVEILHWEFNPETVLPVSLQLIRENLINASLNYDSLALPTKKARELAVNILNAVDAEDF